MSAIHKWWRGVSTIIRTLFGETSRLWFLCDRWWWINGVKMKRGDDLKNLYNTYIVLRGDDDRSDHQLFFVKERKEGDLSDFGLIGT